MIPSRAFRRSGGFSHPARREFSISDGVGQCDGAFDGVLETDLGAKIFSRRAIFTLPVPKVFCWRLVWNSVSLTTVLKHRAMVLLVTSGTQLPPQPLETGGASEEIVSERSALFIFDLLMAA